MFKLQETQLKSWRGYRSGFVRFNFSHTLFKIYIPGD